MLFKRYPIANAIPDAIAPIINVSRDALILCLFTTTPFAAPINKNATPVKIPEYKNALSSNDGKNNARTKNSNGIKPTTRKLIKVAVADFKGVLSKRVLE